MTAAPTFAQIDCATTLTGGNQWRRDSTELLADFRDRVEKDARTLGYDAVLFFASRRVLQ